MSLPLPEVTFTQANAWGWTEQIATASPLNPMVALMEAPPLTEPLESRDELQAFREAVVQCQGLLNERDQYTINAKDVERLSYSQLATRMGISKSQAERDHKQALARLAPYLRSHPLIQERHHALQPTTWNEAAADAVHYLAVLGEQSETQQGFASLLRQGKRIIQAGWQESGGELTDILLDIGAGALGELGNDHILTLIELLCERHHKYGVHNILAYREFGLLVRMSDKWARIQNNAGDFADEAAVDAWYDLVGYAAIAHMLNQDTFNLPLETSHA